MRIVHLSASDGEGGAARAAHRLHVGLTRAGHDSRMLVRKRTTCDPAVMQFSAGWSAWRRALGFLRAWRIEGAIRRSYRARPAGLGPFSDDRSRFGSAIAAAVPSCDVVNLHWVAGDYLDYDGFFRVFPTQAPVVWTLHDMNVFTGGCHYAEGCDRFLSGCGCCPQLGSSQKGDLSRRVFDRKRRVFEGLAHTRGFRIVTLSRWMERLAGQSPLLKGIPVSLIPNGLDTDCYQPYASDAVRRALGIGPGEKMVLFVAENLESRRKGMAVLLDALRMVRNQVANVRLVCVGMLRNAPARPDVPLISLGFVSDDRLLALIYGAADVFVIPSLMENLACTVMEAMACGIPVAGFDAGGIPDMVRQGETGLLAPVGDAGKLAEALTALLRDDDLRRRLGAAARRTALEEYTLARQVSAYERLYADAAIRA